MTTGVAAIIAAAIAATENKATFLARSDWRVAEINVYNKLVSLSLVDLAHPGEPVNLDIVSDHPDFRIARELKQSDILKFELLREPVGSLGSGAGRWLKIQTQTA